MKNTQAVTAGKRTQPLYVPTRDLWAEDAALRGQLTSGQTREVLATVIKQLDDLLEASRNALCDSVDATTYPDGPCLPKATRDALRFAIGQATQPDTL